MTTVSNRREDIQARLAELRARRSTFTTEDGRPITELPEFAPPPPPKHEFKTGGVLAQAKELSLSDDAKELTTFLDSIPFAQAIKLWGKPQDAYKPVGTNSVLIRCPKPEHPDKRPSASADLERGLWRCHACNEGGDRYTLAAIRHNVADYQNGKNFVDLKTRMAIDLGYTVTETGGQAVLTAPGAVPPANPAVPVPVPAPAPLVQTDDGDWVNPATGELVGAPPIPTPLPEVPDIPGAPTESDPDDDDFADRVIPSLDWKPLGMNGSFLDAYMRGVTREEYPEEFAFAAALLCLSFIGGRRVTLAGRRPITSALGVVTVAGTGTGKTRALSDAYDVLEAVMPWRGAELAIASGGAVIPGSGVRKPKGVGSGENLIRQFEDVVSVPVGTDASGKTLYEDTHCPVNGLISFEELSQMIGKSSTQGSTLRERIFSFLDTPTVVESSSNTAGAYKAVKPFACLYTSVQPSLIHQLLSAGDERSGQLNRLWCFTGTKRPLDYLDFDPIDLDPAIEALRDLRDFWEARGDVTVTYTPEAATLMGNYQRTVSEPLEQSGNGLFGRLRLTFWKLILLVCINERRTEATPDVINKAIALHSYLIETYRYLAGELYDPSDNLAESSGSRAEARIIEYVKRISAKRRAKGLTDPADFSLTATEIRTSVKRYFDSSPNPASALNRSLAALVELGALVKVQGTRSVRYLIPEDL